MTNGDGNSGEDESPGLRAAIRRLNLGALIWRERRVLLPALAASIVGPLAGLAMPFAAKLVVDEVIGKGRRELLFPIALGAVIGLMIQAGAAYVAAQFGAIAGQRVATRLRQRLQRHTMRLPVRFFDSQQSGALVSRVITDTDQVRGLLGSEMLQLVSGAFSGAIGFAVLWSINWRLTAIVAALLVAVLFGLARGFHRLHSTFRTAAELQAALAGRLTQVLGGIMVVKTCAAERREAHRFARDTHGLLRASVQASRGVSILIAAIALTIGGVSLVLLVLGGQAVVAGGMTLGDLTLFIVLVGLLSNPVVQTAAIGSELGRALAALARIGEVLDLPVEGAAEPGRLVLPALAGGVLFDAVSYAYVPGRPVLRGVNFFAPPGSTTALTGPNGAGKSTLLGLLMGFDEPTTGHILIDGLPLGALRLREYRRHIGVVLQGNELLDGTIGENIRYGRPAASVEEFRRAARLAHCDEFVEVMPDGYETVVGERGVKLSGGQRQRVAIARAILADPRILLLDEATNQLDSESERLIQEALAVLCGGRTTFVIAHRLATIQWADQILVLQSGAVIEQGTHEELLVMGGRYARLYEMKYQAPLDLSSRWTNLDVTERRDASSHANGRAPNVA
jgi:ATP-binding cassette, subfamily B, putative efflux pump